MESLDELWAAFATGTLGEEGPFVLAAFTAPSPVKAQPSVPVAPTKKPRSKRMRNLLGRWVCSGDVSAEPCAAGARVDTRPPLQPLDLNARFEACVVTPKISRTEARRERERAAVERTCGSPTQLARMKRLVHLPLLEAAKELKLSGTMLKLRCRALGLPRWPYRSFHMLRRVSLHPLAKAAEVALVQRDLARGPPYSSAALLAARSVTVRKYKADRRARESS
jgi:hypothetical protein